MCTFTRAGLAVARDMDCGPGWSKSDAKGGIVLRLCLNMGGTSEVQQGRCSRRWWLKPLDQVAGDQVLQRVSGRAEGYFGAAVWIGAASVVRGGVMDLAGWLGVWFRLRVLAQAAGGPCGGV